MTMGREPARVGAWVAHITRARGTRGMGGPLTDTGGEGEEQEEEEEGEAGRVSMVGRGYMSAPTGLGTMTTTTAIMRVGDPGPAASRRITIIATTEAQARATGTVGTPPLDGEGGEGVMAATATVAMAVAAGREVEPQTTTGTLRTRITATSSTISHRTVTSFLSILTKQCISAAAATATATAAAATTLRHGALSINSAINRRTRRGLLYITTRLTTRVCRTT
jgi:hypothetical protein